MADHSPDNSNDDHVNEIPSTGTSTRASDVDIDNTKAAVDTGR